MESSVIIKSAKDGTELEFSHLRNDQYRVRVQGLNHQATISVDGFTTTHLLETFFDDLSKNWRGWKGEKRWKSLEGEFTLSATTDSTGHVSLKVYLDYQSYAFGWNLVSKLLIEAGQLEQIASEMKTLVAKTRQA